MQRAIREGTIRFNLQQKAGYKPYGSGAVKDHIGGRLAEIVFAECYLGIEAPEDIDLQAALKRVWDVGGYHIRSSPYHLAGMLVRPKDPHGVYAQVLTHDAPTACYITGWLTKKATMEQVELAPMRKYPTFFVYDVPQKLLIPFPSVGDGKVMVHDCMSMQLAA